MSFSFLFPPQRQKFQIITSTDQIRQLLQRQKLDSDNFYRKQFKIESCTNGKYVYVKCRFCTSKLSYKWNEEQESYRLKLFENHHTHNYSQNTSQIFLKWMEKLPLDIELATAKKLAIEQFGVSSSKFYHTYQKLRRASSTLNQLIQLLQRRNYDISLDSFPEQQTKLPRIIVVISPLMKEMFQKYGQVVCFDLTYNVINQLHGNKQFAVGIFTGVNCYNRIIPFGISITCDQTAQSFIKIFQTFIQVNGNPKTFITDEQNSLASALNTLKNNNVFLGTHLLDALHVIRNFTKVSNRKDLMPQLRDIIKQEKRLNFEVMMTNLKRKLNKQNEHKALYLFDKKTKKLCFSQLPAGSFVIFNSSNSINQKMNDMLKARIRKRKPYAQVLKTLVQFGDSLIKYSQQSVQLYDFRIQQVFNDHNLKICRYLLAKRPMKQLLRQYVLSLSLQEPFVDAEQFIFEQDREKGERYQCNYNGKQFICSCGYTDKTGIGCRHLLYICRVQKQDYLQTVHKRWKFESKQIIKIDKRKGKITQKQQF